MTFKNFISLGTFCGVAASMSKLGLRSTSCPFDWYHSELIGVLETLRNDFSDFLNKDNLVLNDKNQKIFTDVKYGFEFRHEIFYSLNVDYDYIQRKYNRRINRFRELVKEKTCFIRAVKNDKELQYIREHKAEIDSLIKSYNKDNEIIYCVSNIAPDKELKYPYFSVGMRSGESSDSLRAFFDTNQALQDFLISNIDKKQRDCNIYFDSLRHSTIQIRELNKLKRDYMVLLNIENCNVDKNTKMPKSVMIYGGGLIGKHLYRKIKDHTNCVRFIDKKPREVSNVSIPIITPDALASKEFRNNDIPIIITPIWYNEIVEELKTYQKDLNMVSVDDFVKEIMNQH